MTTPKPKAILLFGPPGAGKGTIGAMICAAGNHFHLSSGDIFRGLPPESENGALFYQYANSGKLVPDDITVQIWWRYVKGLMDTNRFYPNQQLMILDGIPRTVEQARLIEKYVEVIHVIVLTVDDEEIVVRRINRRAKMENRVDDASESIIRRRLREYREKTKLVLDFYPKEMVSTFNAENSPIEVLRDVLVGCAHFLKFTGHPAADSAPATATASK